MMVPSKKKNKHKKKTTKKNFRFSKKLKIMEDEVFLSKFLPQAKARDLFRRRMVNQDGQIYGDCAYLTIFGRQTKTDMTPYIGNLLNIYAIYEENDSLEKVFFTNGYSRDEKETSKDESTIVLRKNNNIVQITSDSGYPSAVAGIMEIWDDTYITYEEDDEEEEENGTKIRLVFWPEEPVTFGNTMRTRVLCHSTSSTMWTEIAETIMKYEQPPFSLTWEVTESFWALLFHFVISMQHGMQTLLNRVMHWNTRVLRHGGPDTKMRMFLLSSDPKISAYKATSRNSLVIFALEKDIVARFGLGMWQLTTAKQKPLFEHLVSARFQDITPLPRTFFKREVRQLRNERTLFACPDNYYSFGENGGLQPYKANLKQTIAMETFYHDDVRFLEDVARGVHLERKYLPSNASCTRNWDPDGAAKNIYKYLAEKDRVVFFFPSSLTVPTPPLKASYTAWCSTKDILTDQAASVFYECTEEDSAAAHKSVQLQRPYVRLQIASFPIYVSQGNYDLVRKRIAENMQLFVVYDTPYRLPFSISQTAYDSKEDEAWVSADHCQEGSDKKLYVIFPFYGYQRSAFAPLPTEHTLLATSVASAQTPTSRARQRSRSRGDKNNNNKNSSKVV